MEQEESPWKSPVYEFLMFPVFMIVIALIKFITLVQPVGYATFFSHGPLSDEEMDEWEFEEDDWDE